MLLLKTYENFDSDDPWGEDSEPELPYNYLTDITILAPKTTHGHYDIFKAVIHNVHVEYGKFLKKAETIFVHDKNDMIDIINFCRWANEKQPDTDDIEKVGFKKFGQKLYQFLYVSEDPDRQVCRPYIHNITYFDIDGVERNVKIDIKK